LILSFPPWMHFMTQYFFVCLTFMICHISCTIFNFDTSQFTYSPFLSWKSNRQKAPHFSEKFTHQISVHFCPFYSIWQIQLCLNPGTKTTYLIFSIIFQKPF
jgi:hypothetical protein